MAQEGLILTNGSVSCSTMGLTVLVLNKCPRVCPIGVGECLRCILSHVLGFVTGWEA